jgi:hypothetical protein
MSEAWRLVPLEDSRNVDPLSSISDPIVLKKARAIWEKIKDSIELDSDQRVVYNADEKGSPLPLLLSFLTDGRDTTRPVDAHRFVSLIRPYVPVSLIAVNKRNFYRRV